MRMKINNLLISLIKTIQFIRKVFLGDIWFQKKEKIKKVKIWRMKLIMKYIFNNKITLKIEKIFFSFSIFCFPSISGINNRFAQWTLQDISIQRNAIYGRYCISKSVNYKIKNWKESICKGFSWSERTFTWIWFVRLVVIFIRVLSKKNYVMPCEITILK